MTSMDRAQKVLPESCRRKARCPAERIIVHAKDGSVDLVFDG